MNSGHYISIVKSANHWLVYDDDTVEVGTDAATMETDPGLCRPPHAPLNLLTAHH